jgi:gas vesicle structural protein
MATDGRAAGYLQRAPSPSGLADVIDTILDKGLVIDAYVRVSVIGIELVAIDARIVIASVDTYLRFAEAVNRLDLSETQLSGLPELRRVAAEEVTKRKIDKVTPDLPAPDVSEGSTLRTAAKGAAAGAVVAGAAVAAKEIADRLRGEEEEAEQEEDSS